MFFTQKALSFVDDYITDLDLALQSIGIDKRLSFIQKSWFSFCLMGIYMTNSICWRRFERISLGQRNEASISWMFRHAKIPWMDLLVASTKILLKKYAIKAAILALDEVDRARSKRTPQIFKAYKQRDKASSGYVNGQTIVALVLITDKIVFPVGFMFYMPDSEVKKWKLEDAKLRKEGVAKKDRPEKPAPNPEYPSKMDISLMLLRNFHVVHPDIEVKAVVADALYGTAYFMDEASEIFGGVQVVSQLHKNQNICYRNRVMGVEHYFQSYPGVPQGLKIRGKDAAEVTMGSIRVHVSAHNKKRFVIALKYDGEEEYRYLLATDMSWRTVDIAQVYTLRWLIEVFFEDWKSYEGWGKLAKQTGEKGSVRGVILSLLCDHCLLLHPEQMARIEKKLPAYTVGSLQRRTQADAFVMFLYNLWEGGKVSEKIDEIKNTIEELFTLQPSEKHMSGKDLGRMEPTPSLKYKGCLS